MSQRTTHQPTASGEAVTASTAVNASSVRNHTRVAEVLPQSGQGVWSAECGVLSAECGVVFTLPSKEGGREATDLTNTEQKTGDDVRGDADQAAAD